LKETEDVMRRKIRMRREEGRKEGRKWRKRTERSSNWKKI
jgi:hypothetical protein